jgi:hypothetical protein
LIDERGAMLGRQSLQRLIELLLRFEIEFEALLNPGIDRVG